MFDSFESSFYNFINITEKIIKYIRQKILLTSNPERFIGCNIDNELYSIDNKSTCTINMSNKGLVIELLNDIKSNILEEHEKDYWNDTYCGVD